MTLEDSAHDCHPNCTFYNLYIFRPAAGLFAAAAWLCS